MSKWHPKTTWSDDEDAFLADLCKTTKSYGEIAKLFNARFPKNPKTRNAILGRSSRQGHRPTKPRLVTFGVTDNMRKSASANFQSARSVTAARKRAIKAEAEHGRAVVFDAPESVLLRNEADRGDANSPTGSRRRSANDPVVIERKKGMLPAVVESSPLTSIPMIDATALDCMWPTNIECTEVCGVAATVGSYCARHALHAYRIMPTTKRNRIRHKEDVEHAKRIDGSHHRSELDADGAWLNRMIIDSMPTAPDEPEAEPLLLEHKR